MKLNKIIAICAMALVAFGAQANASSEAKSAATMKQHAYDRGTTLSFNTGSSTLDTSEQAKLKNLILTIGVSHISQVELAVWSDQSMPIAGAELTKDDRELADNRIAAIKDFMKEYVSTYKIKDFNMAETSNWLTRALRTDDAELKSVFSKQAAPPMGRADFSLIQENGAPSKAVVVFIKK